VTNSVLGQPQGHHRSGFEKNGWTPVTTGDFEGQFDGFMPKGQDGEISIDGTSVLMMRPKELSDAAKLRDQQAARAQVKRKEDFLTGENAVQSNRISKSYEKIAIPES
jgi:hypothetical protein